jgi:hypothetical protein
VTPRTATAVLACALAFACERKAPGPAECRAFALRVYGVRDETELDHGMRNGIPLRESVDELTRDCLVVPYDRQLLRCATETGRIRACRAAFERRRVEGSADAWP